LTLTLKKEQERVVSRGGNSSVLYLPREYFTPGEKIGSQLEIDPDGNLRMILTKRLFNFTCDSVKELIGSNFTAEYDKMIAGNRIFSATQGDLTVSCTKSTRDLEPTYLTVSKRFEIHSLKEYTTMKDCINSLAKKGFDAYIEPEGDLEAVNIYKNPQRYKLKDEYEAVEALIATGKKIELSVVARFDSKKDHEDQIKRALTDLES
jgi:hypothetical protein